jgi:hypothetical protein
MPRHGPIDPGPQPRLHPTRRHRSSRTWRAVPAGRARPRRIRARRVLPRNRRDDAQGLRPDRPGRALRHRADVHRAAGRERPRLRRPRPPLLRPVEGAQSGLGAPGRGDPAADRQAAAPPQRLRQPLAGVQHRQGRRALQPRPVQEGRDLAPDRADGRPDQPDELGRLLRRLRSTGFGGNFNLYGVLASSSSARRSSSTPTAACATASCRPCAPTPRNTSG